MKKKRYDLATGLEFVTRAQLTQVLGVSRSMVDRLIATGELTQYRSGPGVGHGGQRVFYSRAQARRIKAQLSGRRRRARRTRASI